MQCPRSARPLVLAAFTAALIAGCSQLPTSPAAPGQESHLGVSTTAAPASLLVLPSVSKLVNGLLGGVVEMGNWKVVVPAGAFLGTATITIQVPDPNVRQCDLSISPASLNAFKVPVALWCRFDSPAEASSSNIQWWDPSAKVWRVVPSMALLSSRIALLPHFSTYRAGRAGW